MPSFGLYRTSYPHFMTTFTIYDITCNIFIPSTHYIWHLIYSVWCHIHYVCYITKWPYLWHQTLYVFAIFTWYGIRHSVMTTKPLCAFPATMPDITLNVFWHYTQCTNFLKRSECMSSHLLYVWHHMQYIWHHIHSLLLHTIEVITLYPLHSWHHTPNIWHNT